MAWFSEKLWNWGHLEGSHNGCTPFDCSMTPEEFAREYGIPNAFIVSYGGNIQPPYGELAKRFEGLGQLKWSAVGDASTPLPEHRLGNVPDVIALSETADNLNGSVVDDFFSPVRVKRFTPEVLAEMKAALNAKGLDFWCVLYSHELDTVEELERYTDCFDGITFWFWGCDRMGDMASDMEKVFALAKGKPVMMGVYLWDYAQKRAMDTELFIRQLNEGRDMLLSGKLEGMVFCSSTLGDADIETNRILNRWVKKNGDTRLG